MYYTALFWIGFLVLLAVHVIQLVDVQIGMVFHALISLAGTAAMFLGSKIGREFLGIKA